MSRRRKKNPTTLMTVLVASGTFVVGAVFGAAMIRRKIADNVIAGKFARVPNPRRRPSSVLER